jgi:hypothetical protein
MYYDSFALHFTFLLALFENLDYEPVTEKTVDSMRKTYGKLYFLSPICSNA